MSFFEELKRRNVFRVAIAYAIASWVLLQVADLVLENIGAPDWMIQSLMLIVALGFVVALVIAWAYELTPEGIRKESEVDRSQSIVTTTGKKLDRIVIGFLLLAVAILLYRQAQLATPETASGPQGATPQSAEAGAVGSVENNNAIAPPDRSIAVLPFRDMSQAGDQAYFGEGIAEELLNALVKLDGVEVASRTSSFSLAGEGLDVPSIAERLDVAHILEGSVRTAGNRVRVTAQLIEVANDKHLWSETYDGTLDDIFQIQDEITGKITEALKVQLGDRRLTASAEALTGNAEAYQAYLQGRHLWRQRGIDSLHAAVRLFKRALELDPEFHQAWSNLGLAYFNLPDYDASVDFDTSYQLGLDAAEKALAIDPRSSEALILKANANDSACRIVEGVRLYEEALTHNPNDPTAHHWYQILLANAGRNRLALEHIQKAREIDPLISAVIANEAQAYMALGEHERARSLYREAIGLGFPSAHFELGKSYFLTGDVDEAIELMRRGTEDENPLEAYLLGFLFDAMKNPAAVDKLTKHIDMAKPGEYFDTTLELDFLALVGSPYAMAFQDQMECPVVVRTLWLDTFREQRGTPEFFDLMDRAGFVEYWRQSGWPDDCASLDQELADCPQ